jgi:MscS family membrane protein
VQLAPAPAPAPPPAPRATPGAAPRPAVDVDVNVDADGDDTAIPVAPDSPRASVSRYLELCRTGDFTEAAQYLDAAPRADAPELARQLKAVLDRRLWIEPGDLSPLPFGDAKDGLPPGVEDIGKIPGPGGAEPVRLVRRAGAGGGARWVFSRATVARVHDWYGRLEDRWLRDHLPEALLRPGPRELLWWQWLALPSLVIAGWVAGRALGYVGRLIAGRITRRTATTLDDALVDRTRAPFTFAGGLLAIYLMVPWLGLYEPAEAFIDRVLRAGGLVSFFWLALRAVDTTGEHLLRTQLAHEPPDDDDAPDRPAGPAPTTLRSLVPLLSRIAKIAVVVMGIIAVLSELGYPVASLVAGLGIGGIALALAAQKTVENLFGSLSIGLDKPFRVGDFIRVDALVGTVEAIGFRSTRIRTLDRTLVTIPNGKLADMHLETFAARDRIRLACTLGLVYGTTSEQMRAVLEGVRRVLSEHPKIWPDSIVVRLAALGASSLDIEVMAWFQTTEADEFGAIRQEVLLSFMEVVEGAGSSFAFPTRTLHLAPPPDRKDTAAGAPGAGAQAEAKPRT